MQKTTEEKQHHLAGILRSAARGALDEKIIEWILSIVYINRQYAVLAFSDSKVFHDAIENARAEDTLMSVVPVKSENGTAAAVIMPVKHNETEKDRRTILLYAPGCSNQRGDHNAKRA